MVRIHRYLALLVAMVLLAGISGCAGLFRPVESLQVNLADLRLQDATLFEQRFVLVLRIQNPNSFAIPVEGVQYSLDLDNEEFARGVSSTKVEIPALGSGLVEVEAVSTTLALIRQLGRLGAQGEKAPMAYRVRGVVHALRLRNIAFDQQGEIDLSALMNHM